MKKGLLVASVVLLVNVCFADSHVSTFFDRFTTFSADFSQTVKQDDKVVQQSTGRVKLKKPLKFRWDYQSPEKMQLISDGQRFYHYDIELAQATVKPAAEVADSVLMTLLSGRETLDSLFHIQSFGTPAVKKRFPKQADSWLAGADIFYQLVPKKTMNADTTPSLVVVGLSANQQLRLFYAKDNFGENTFVFSDVKQNRTIADSTFKFKPPRGVDVLGQ
ncbi:MAG: outer membrane lipoprotein carrier protein LolA [Gammaproteobacteria bacterium]|nr:MAG: outer membrane lipoprotein carrier protein LolA [Gammaproteobacteria bacterium]